MKKKKKTGNINWDFLLKAYLSSLFFLVIRWLVYWILYNLILIPNLILLIFQFFFLLEKRERVTGFWLRERNFLLLKNLVTKMIIFLCLMVKVKIICFFNLKTPKKSYMSSEIFFCFGWILDFKAVFYAFHGYELI